MRRMPVLLVPVSAAFLLTVTASPSPLGAQPQEPPPFHSPQQAPSKQQQPKEQQAKEPQTQQTPGQPTAQPPYPLPAPVAKQPPSPLPAPAVLPKQAQPLRPQATPAAAAGGVVNGPTRAGGLANPGGANRYAVDMTFVDPSGLTLGNRVAHVTVGRSEDVAVQDKQRTVTAATTVRPGRKPGCARIDVVVRDRSINASGQFNKTVWESGSEPCAGTTITLGPKNEVNVRVAIWPEK